MMRLPTVGQPLATVLVLLAASVSPQTTWAQEATSTPGNQGGPLQQQYQPRLMAPGEELPPNIRLLNPATNRSPVSYTLSGFAFAMRPGEKQDLQADQRWIIEFNRGDQFGVARYGLRPGIYRFTPTDKGWELYQDPWPTFLDGSASPPLPIPAETPPANYGPVEDIAVPQLSPLGPTDPGYSGDRWL
jgi:hypothetical protein